MRQYPMWIRIELVRVSPDGEIGDESGFVRMSSDQVAAVEDRGGHTRVILKTGHEFLTRWNADDLWSML